MSDINQTGVAGTVGTNGTIGSINGTAGGPGGNQTTTNNGNGVDTTNSAEATGGQGGAGGNGFNAAGTGGNAGAGGNGGNAIAGTTTTLNSSSGISSSATAIGGAGGNAGTPGNSGTANSGAGAGGGYGGTATADAAATNTTGNASGTATSAGGAGGAGNRAGQSGGAGGLASGTTATASGHSAYATATQRGGSGGSGLTGANGGAGASSSLTNAVSGSTTGGTLRLSQTATGGAGGSSTGGTGGQGGAAGSSLTFNDVTANPTPASSLKGYSTAAGGNSGNGETVVNGGAATSSIALTGAQTVNATATATGGAGGGISSTTGNGAVGGASTASATAMSTTVGTENARAGAYAYGGSGGSSGSTSGSGGAGGAATGSSATATEAGATKTTVYRNGYSYVTVPVASASVNETGGAGGRGFGTGQSGGAGGVASGATASASGYAASASVTQTGGSGGRGYSGAGGGVGASSTLTNAVSGTTTGGYLKLYQMATGGAGGYSSGGAGGLGGAGNSSLSFNDVTANPLHANSLTGTSTGTGGASGIGATAVSGGAATSSIALTGANEVTARATATGGAGGGVISGATGNGAMGGAAMATASATATTSSTTGFASADATAIGGSGGEGSGTGQSGGAGGVASLGPVIASGFDAFVTATQTGGSGGSGINGASGGAGANSTLTNAVSASTTGGSLRLTQTATGGAGGYSNGGLAGQAGVASSSLSFNDVSGASALLGYSKATGGYGGASRGSSNTANGGAGGPASANATLSGGNDIGGIYSNYSGPGYYYRSVRAVGGHGGRAYGSGAGGVGGAATATGVATSTTKGSSAVQASADATGGAGGGNFGIAGSGGAGGAAIGASETATELTATGGRATAIASQSGGSGGRGVGVGQSGGAGGVASATTATATGKSAVAKVSQTGGAGGRGYGGAAGGAGADSTLTNAVSGRTMGGYLGLYQAATGGAGGYSSGGAGGPGGAANSSLTFNDVTANPARASTLTGTSTATGGAGGGSSTGSGAASGAATAVINLTGVNTVNASAAATTANGQLADATSAASGSSGQAKTTATTSASGVVKSVSAVAQAQLGGAVTTVSQADIAGTVFGFNGTLENSYSFATGLPNAAFVSSILASNPNIDAALGTGQAAVFGAGVLGGFFVSSSTGSQTYQDSIDWTINPTNLSGHLVAGLIANQTFGSGFSSLQFSVNVGSTQVVNDTFTTLASAQSFFDDQALDLGSFATSANLAVDFNFKLVTSSSGAGFGADLLLATTGGHGSPIITAPASVVIGQSHPTPITDVSLTENGDTTGETFTVTLSDTSGALTATGGTQSNAGTTLTITGSLSQVNTDLETLTDTDGATPSDTITINASDSIGGHASPQMIAVTVNGPPVVAAAATATVQLNHATPIGGVSLSETGNTSGETFTVTLTDANGDLAATGEGVSGSGTTDLTITGSLGQVNADLATLTDTDASSSPDTITINASDSLGNTATQKQIAVTVQTSSPLVITAPATATVGVGQPGVITGVSISESPTTTGETFTVTLSDANGVLAATGGTQSNGGKTLTVTGSLSEVNADLATLTDTDASSSPDTITINASDRLGNTATQKQIAVTVQASSPPVITAPTTATVGVGQPGVITGVSISESPTTTGETFTVTLSDANGVLAATGGTQSNGGKTRTITGSLSEVNADLATLTDTDATTPSDTITINASDNNGRTATPTQIAVTVNGLPIITAPALVGVAVGQATAINGVTLSESGDTSNETFTVALTDTSGDLSARGTGVSGSGTTSLTITGSLNQVNSALATLTDTDSTTDTITINASDSLSNEALQGAIPLTTEPVISTSSGTLVRNGNAYVLNLGTVTEGDTPELFALSLLNDTSAPTDLISAQFAISNATGFFNSFNGISGLGAGDESVAGYVALNTSTLGQFAETITLSPERASVGALPAETIVIEGDVQSPPPLPAAAAAAPLTSPAPVTPPDSLGDAVIVPQSIDFGNVRVGANASQTISVTNGARPPGNGLDAEVSEVLGDATGSGSITDLPARSTDSSSITVGIETSTLGAKSGTVTIDLASESNSPSVVDNTVLDFKTTNQSIFGTTMPSPFDLTLVNTRLPIGPVAGAVDGFSLSLAGSVADKLDLNLGALLAGSARVDYPVDASVKLPGSVNPGQSFTIDTGDTGHGQIALSTSFAGLANFSLDEALTYDFSAGAKVPLFPEQTINTGVQTVNDSAGVNASSPSLSLDLLPGVSLSESLPASPITTDETVPSGAFGLLPNVISMGSSGNFLSISGDLIELLFAAAGVKDPLDIKLPGDNELDLLGLDVSAGLALSQEFVFHPTGIAITIIPNFDPSQNQTGQLGDPFTFSVPSSWNQPVVLNTSYSITGTLSTQTGIAPQLADELNAGTLAFNFFGDSGLKFKLGPLFSVELPKLTGSDLVDTQPAPFTLGGFNTVTQDYIIPIGSASGGGSNALPSQTIDVSGNVIAPQGNGTGDVHLTTYDGLHYDFQAEGEFILTQSTASGNSFQVQIRLQPWFTSASVSVMTMIAAAVGTDRVTFGLNRANPVWIDGSPSSLSSTNTVINLNGGQVVQLSSASWKLTWNTGETMTVTDSGAYFGISVSLSPLDAPGSVHGLFGPDEGAANDFQLADGAVVPQPLTSAQLYGEYANAWRITQANSLLDYGPNQTTGTFTDLNFPGDALSLANLPQNVVNQAAAAVAAAGVTDPNLTADAELDYIATGDTSFITADGQGQSGTTGAAITASTPPEAAAGINAAASSVIETAGQPTPVTFNVYLTSASSNDTPIDWTVIAPNSAYLGASTFGGTLPSGTVTISAGQTGGQFEIDVAANALGTQPSETLAVQISAPDGNPIFAVTGETVVTDSLPVPGNAPAPVLEDLTNLGTFTQSGNAYTLDLGTVPLSAVPQIQFALANNATAPADGLAGSFSVTSGSGVDFVGDGAISDLPAGQVYQGLSAIIESGNPGSNSETLTFAPKEFNASGYSAQLPDVTLTINYSVNALPVITAPTMSTVGVGKAAAIAGVGIAEFPTTIGESFTAVLADTNGVLSASVMGGATVTPSNGGKTLTIEGALSQVNAALATLSDTGATAGSDAITVNASDSNNGHATPANIAVTVNGPPSITAPTMAIVQLNQATAITGVSVSETGNTTTSGETFTVTLSDSNGVLTATGGTQSNGGKTLTIAGSLNQVNSALGTLTDTDASIAADAITVNAKDSFGNSATQQTITVPPQPIAGNARLDIAPSQTLDLTSALLALDTPGEPGDALALTAVGTSGTRGVVTLHDGDLSYTAPASGSSDAFTYTVTDEQLHESATGNVSVTLNPSLTGNGTFNFTGSGNIVDVGNGNDQVSLSGNNNTVAVGGGNDSLSITGNSNFVTAGGGNDHASLTGNNDTLTLGGGNDSASVMGNNDALALGNGNDNVTVIGTGESVTAGTGNDTFALGGSMASLFLHGQHDAVSVNGGTDTITDTPGSTDGLMLQIGALGGIVGVANFDVAKGAVLLAQALASSEGWTTSGQIASALGTDGHGGSLLSFGAQGSIDFQNVPKTQLTANNFHIG
jgi:hypothetical protein